MKFLTSTLLLLSLITYSSSAQKYALLDKKMVKPIIYTDLVSMQHSQEGYFPVEKDRLHEFIKELEKINTQLSEPRMRGNGFTSSVGSTVFKALKIKFGKEDRLDVTMITNCGNIAVNMHLTDASSSTWRNSFYINTWIKYIRKHIKTENEKI